MHPLRRHSWEEGLRELQQLNHPCPHHQQKGKTHNRCASSSSSSSSSQDGLPGTFLPIHHGVSFWHHGLTIKNNSLVFLFVCCFSLVFFFFFFSLSFSFLLFFSHQHVSVLPGSAERGPWRAWCLQWKSSLPSTRCQSQAWHQRRRDAGDGKTPAGTAAHWVSARTPRVGRVAHSSSYAGIHGQQGKGQQGKDQQGKGNQWPG